MADEETREETHMVEVEETTTVQQSTELADDETGNESGEGSGDGDQAADAEGGPSEG